MSLCIKVVITPRVLCTGKCVVFFIYLFLSSLINTILEATTQANKKKNKWQKNTKFGNMETLVLTVWTQF